MAIFESIKNWVSQKSTQLGLVALAGIAGYNIAPDQIGQISTILGIVTGAILFFNKEKGTVDAPGFVGYLKGRLSEPTSKAAIIGLAAIGGYTVSPEHINMIITVLGLIGGALAVFTNEKK